MESAPGLVVSDAKCGMDCAYDDRGRHEMAAWDLGNTLASAFYLQIFDTKDTQLLVHHTTRVVIFEHRAGARNVDSTHADTLHTVIGFTNRNILPQIGLRLLRPSLLERSVALAIGECQPIGWRWHSVSAGSRSLAAQGWLLGQMRSKRALDSRE